MKENELITIEETLTNSDMPSEMQAMILLQQILMGAVKSNVWINIVGQNTELVGTNGTVVDYPFATKLAGGDQSADSFEANPSFNYADPTISSVPIGVTKQQFCASKISKILMENLPKLDLINNTLANIGLAMKTKLNADILDAVIAGSTQVGSCQTLSYETIIDALADMQTDGKLAQGQRATLILSPKDLASLIKGTDVSSKFSMADLEKVVDVVSDPYLDGEGYAFLYPIGFNEPIVDVIFKRLFTVETQYVMDEQLTKLLNTARYVVGVVQGVMVGKIVISGSP